jgi:hypothetical protein
VVHYEAYYLGLFAAWQVGIHVNLVSTHTGDRLVDATGSRWDVSVLPALTPEDIAINSAENILELRDINLARAEDEACREVVKRVPQSDQLITEMAARAREHELRVEAHVVNAAKETSLYSFQDEDGSTNHEMETDYFALPSV